MTTTEPREMNALLRRAITLAVGFMKRHMGDTQPIALSGAETSLLCRTLLRLASDAGYVVIPRPLMLDTDAPCSDTLPRCIYCAAGEPRVLLGTSHRVEQPDGRVDYLKCPLADAEGIGSDDPHDGDPSDHVHGPTGSADTCPGLSERPRKVPAYPEPFEHLEYLHEILLRDEQVIQAKEHEYRASWKARGGIGAFMMLARKWDRLEPQVQAHHYDVFAAGLTDTRAEGILDDIQDLRRYLALVECEIALLCDRSRVQRSEQVHHG